MHFLSGGLPMDQISGDGENNLTRNCCSAMNAIIKKGTPRFTGDAFICFEKAV
jgi:hypothetical protein